MRRVTTFACKGDTLVGTVDEAAGTTGLLIVSGGNEVRCGAHRGMALLAERLARAGMPVFRFDRRGIGDSEGENRGYAGSKCDIAAALTAFRDEQPQVMRIIGFGNCDAATALLLLDRDCDALVLANPWLGDEEATPPPSALRTHYARRLRDLATWRHAWSNGVRLDINGLIAALGRPKEQPLSSQVISVLGLRPTTLILASGDRTAQIFAAAIPIPDKLSVARIDTASHSFAGQGEALAAVIEAAIARLHGTSDD